MGSLCGCSWSHWSPSGVQGQGSGETDSLHREVLREKAGVRPANSSGADHLGRVSGQQDRGWHPQRVLWGAGQSFRPQQEKECENYKLGGSEVQTMVLESQVGRKASAGGHRDAGSGQQDPFWTLPLAGKGRGLCRWAGAGLAGQDGTGNST